MHRDKELVIFLALSRKQPMSAFLPELFLGIYICPFLLVDLEHSSSLSLLGFLYLNQMQIQHHI
jgi:hypothetical protein